MAPSTECECTGRRVCSSTGYCRERMRCATRLSTRYARYSLEPDTRVVEPCRRRRACSHAGCARAHGRSGGSAPWPSGWLAAVQRSRDGDSRARQPRPSANGSRQLRWGGSHGLSKRRAGRSPPEKRVRKVACVGVISWRTQTGPPEYCSQHTLSRVRRRNDVRLQVHLYSSERLRRAQPRCVLHSPGRAYSKPRRVAVCAA